MKSQFRLLRAKTTTCGLMASGSSRVPTDTVMNPGILSFRPKSWLPHIAQNVRVTTPAASDSRRYSDISPWILIWSEGNIAPVLCPAPLSRWQSVQWQWATTTASPSNS